MKSCVYCGNEITGNGIYFCDRCKKNIYKDGGLFTTHSVVNDWIINSYIYLERNNGKFWRNECDITDEDKQLQFIRPIDYIRFEKFKEITHKDVFYAMSADHLNEMEEWYMNLAEKEK